MPADTWRRLSGALRQRRHTALLCAIAVAFLVRPLVGDHPAASLAFSLAFLALMLVALYATQIDELIGDRSSLLRQRRRRRVTGLVLAAFAIVERIVALIDPVRPAYAFAALSWLLYFAFIAWCQLHRVLRHRRVTGETISMAISVYLLLGLNWSLLYSMMAVRQPGAFHVAGGTAIANPDDIFPLMLYFSLTTLSTIGYGDITPVSLQARFAAVAEGITGQLYLAILVARLVSLHMRDSAARAAE